MYCYVVYMVCYFLPNSKLYATIPKLKIKFLVKYSSYKEEKAEIFGWDMGLHSLPFLIKLSRCSYVCNSSNLSN